MKLTITIHEISKDGIPDMETTDLFSGRVAFIFDGSIVTGWPLHEDEWEADSSVGHVGPFRGVTHWVEFPEPLAGIEYKRRG